MPRTSPPAAASIRAAPIATEECKLTDPPLIFGSAQTHARGRVWKDFPARSEFLEVANQPLDQAR